MEQQREGQEGPPAQLNVRSLVFNYLLFAGLGMILSIFYNSYYGTYGEIDRKLHLFSVQQSAEFSLDEVRSILQDTNCDNVEKEAKLSTNLRPYMGTKLQYQFDHKIHEESTVGTCRALKVYGLLRHGTRYPTAKYLRKFNTLEENLTEKLTGSTSSMAKTLLNWSNQIGKNVLEGKAEPSALADVGMREQYCLAKRLLRRFPSILGDTPLSYTFRSTMASRAKKSALSFAVGLFEKTKPEVISMITVEEKDDVWLRFDELPCASYDQKITFNSSFEEWLDTFLDTPPFQNVMKHVQQYFNPDHWKLSTKDVLLFYQICIHEASLLGSSSWCKLFGPEELSVMEFIVDLKAYWVRAGGYDITWRRSVNLVQGILNFFKTGKKTVALSFAHAETLLPLTTFFNVVSVSRPLTPTDYQALISREFMTSRIAPYSGNMYFVLYNCTEDTADKDVASELYVRLLANEEPVKIGICDESASCHMTGSDCHVTDKSESDCHMTEGKSQCRQDHYMCRLDFLVERASNLTNKFSPLTELCKAT